VICDILVECYAIMFILKSVSLCTKPCGKECLIDLYVSFLGTPYWMSPEVIEGRGFGRRADIW